MSSSSAQQQVEHVDQVVQWTASILKTFFKDLLANFTDIVKLIQQNATWSKSKIFASVIVALCLWIPLLSWIYTSIQKWYYFIDNIINYEKNVVTLEKSHKWSVKSFFEKYNQKFWVDCDRIRWVKVDYNMADIYNTEYKPWKWCIVNEYEKFFPISFDDLSVNDTKQVARTSWKALMIHHDKEWKMIKMCYLRYNLWKYVHRDQWYWKFDPFEQQECFPMES
jgi:hypothetical protein